MENKKLKEYLDEFKDDAALHVIVANPQDRKIYVPYELNMVLCQDLVQIKMRSSAC